MRRAYLIVANITKLYILYGTWHVLCKATHFELLFFCYFEISKFENVFKICKEFQAAVQWRSGMIFKSIIFKFDSVNLDIDAGNSQ